MPEDDLKVQHCYICNVFTNHRLLGKYDKSQYWNDGKARRLTQGLCYSVLECCGCESIRLKKEAWSEDSNLDRNGDPIADTDIYPPSSFRVLPFWVTTLDPEWHITKLFKEIYKAIKNNTLTLAAMGIRALIEAIMIDKVGDNGSFNKNLNKFKEAGYISEVDKKILSTTLEMGHASMHRGFFPHQGHLEVAVDITEKLLHTLYVLEESAKDASTDIPTRKA